VLREARRARGRTLADLARDTRIPPGALAAIEAGLFDELPRGVYARAWVRSYAAAVGVDPAAVLEIVGPALPRADETLKDICRLRDEEAPVTRRWHYRAASAIDALVVLGINALIWAVSLPVCQCSAPTIPASAVPAMVVMLITTLICYVALLAGISGRTAGTALFGLEVLPKPARPLTLHEILERAATYLLADVRMLARVTRR
jgi:hypothetical protein